MSVLSCQFYCLNWVYIQHKTMHKKKVPNSSLSSGKPDLVRGQKMSTRHWQRHFEGNSERQERPLLSFRAKAMRGSEQCVCPEGIMGNEPFSKGLVCPTGHNFRRCCQSVTTVAGHKTSTNINTDCTEATKTYKEQSSYILVRNIKGKMLPNCTKYLQNIKYNYSNCRNNILMLNR